MKEDVSTEISSADVEHEKEIKNYTEYHEKEVQRSRKLLIRVIMLILAVAMLMGVLLASNAIKDWVNKFSPDNRNFVAMSVHLIASVLASINIMIAIICALLVTKMIIKAYLPEHILLPNILENFSFYFGLMLTLLILHCLVPHELYFPETNLPDDNYWLFGMPSSWSELERGTINDWAYEKLLPGVFKIIGMFFLRDLIIYLLNFNIHYKYYEKRIEKNRDRINVIKAMAELTNAGFVGGMDIIVERFMKIVTSDGPVTRHSLQKYLPEDVVNKIFTYCNLEEEELTEDAAKTLFASTLMEQRSIVKSIEQHNTTVNSFRSVMNVLITPFCIYHILNILPLGGEDSKLMKNTYFLGTLIFSTNYTFSESFKTFASGLVFVFFVRPFEIGDLIVLEDKLYKIHEINLLTSVLFDGHKYTILPNSKLSGEGIKNLRLGSVWDVRYKLKFSIDDLKNIHTSIIEDVNKYISSRSSEFKKEAYLDGIAFVDQGKVEANLVANLNCDISDVVVLYKRRTNLFFKIQELLDGLANAATVY